jgi:hypothetical protein
MFLMKYVADGGKIMSLKEEIEEFRVRVAQTVSALEEIKKRSDSLPKTPVNEVSNKLPPIQSLCAQVSEEVLHLCDCLDVISCKWGTASLKRNLRDIEGGTFLKLIKGVQESQLGFQNVLAGSTQEQHIEKLTKGIMGEALSHLLISEFFQGAYCLDGQTGNIDTSSEEKAYTAARTYLNQHPEVEYVVASRPFGGGQPYSLDEVCMIINRQHIDAWFNDQQSKATYLVYESKTDSSALSEAQKQPSYVERQSAYMSRNKKHEDRSQLGKDILTALQDGRVCYALFHLNTQSYELTTRFIR